MAVAAALVLLAGCATGRAFRAGQNAARRGDWDTAVAYYREALGHDPSRIDVKIALQRAMTIASAEHVKRARDLEAQDQLAGAIAEYKLAADLDPTNALAAAKANELERKQRDRIEAARPPSSIEVLRQQVRQSTPVPKLDPREPNVLVNFAAASVKDILNSIGGMTGINVTYVTGTEALTGHVYSINLQNASLEEALNQVLSNNGLAFKIVNSKTILVFADTAQEHGKYDDIFSQVFYLSNIDPTDMVSIINQMIAPPGGPLLRPQVAPSKSTSAITVKATAPVLAVIEKIIRANDKPKAEVMIEVEILEVDRKRIRQLGLDLNQYALGFTFSPEVSPPNTSGGLPPTVPPPFNLNTISQGVSAADFYLTVPTAVVRMLESDTKTRTLARPQARGQEGQAITLNLGDRIPTVNAFIPQTQTSVGFTTPSANVTYNPIGVNLTITPQVTFEDDIILTLIVDNSGLGPNIDVAGQTFPTFTTRSVQTKLRLRDGESNLLAGLIREQSSKINTGISGLARVPVLRNLFGFSNTTTEQSDVVIVVTPHIVRSHDLTAADLKPMYLGTGQNFGQTGPPQLISPEVPIAGGVTPPAAATPPAAGTPAPTTTRAPGVVPVVPVTPVETPPAAPPQPGTAQVTVTAVGDFQAGSATPYLVPILISNVSNLGTVALQIRYNQTALRAQSVNPGTFMNQGNVAPTFVPRLDTNNGLIEIAISRPGAPTGASATTNALLASIQFLAMSPGSSQISISGTAVTPTGQAIPLQFVPATVVVK